MNTKNALWPWNIHRPQANRTGTSIYLGTGVNFAQVTGNNHAANAALIASAPDLLAALEWALMFAEGAQAGDESLNNPVFNMRLDAARAAIARAKGGQS